MTAFMNWDRAAHVPPPGIKARCGWWIGCSRTILWISPATPTARLVSTSSIPRQLYRPLGLVNPALWNAPDPRCRWRKRSWIRALIAKLWREPQQGQFVRWGPTLHDRFMLPHFLWEDFSGRARRVKQSGYDFSPDWYALSSNSASPFRPRPSWRRRARSAPGA